MNTSKFDAAAQKVQAKMQPGVAVETLDMGGMIEIGVLLLELFSKCMASSNDNPGQVAANMKQPGLFQRIMLRRAVRSHLGRDFNSRGDKLERAILSAADDADANELLELAVESTDPTYY